MPQRTSPARATVTRLAFLAVVGWALVALARKDGTEADASATVDRLEPEAERAVEAPRSRPRSRRQRIATSLAFTTLFFGGAAFSAGAGDMLVQAVENDCDAPAAELSAEKQAACETKGDDASATEEGAGDEGSGDETNGGDVEAETGEAETGETQTGETETGETETGETDGGDADAGSDGDATNDDSDTDEGEAPVEDGDGESGDGESTGDDESPGDNGSSGDGEGPTGDPGDEQAHEGGNDASGNTREPVGEPVLEVEEEHSEHGHALDPEVSASGSVATVWLHRALPDPTPVARRLTPAFARQLRAESERARVHWSTVLAALRADGRKGRAPADRARLRSLATELHDLLRTSGEWHAFLALEGRTAYADRATALADYNRAVGLRALVTGLEAAKPKLEDAVLADARLDIYTGGRADVASGNIDVRVLVLLRYLAERHGQVTVSSLHSGHRVYSRPGVVSAHMYGLAVDIAALGGKSILGNSAPGGVTEKAVRDILLLPIELRPKQVISLLGLGGPSFPMEDHADHIHVGY